MVLVDADRVETAFGGEFELVHEVVVHVMGAKRVEQRGVDIDPHRGMLFAEVLRQFGIGHQVKPHQLHGWLLKSIGSPRCVLRDGAARLLRMRWGPLMPSASIPHAEERPKGASRSTHGPYARGIPG